MAEKAPCLPLITDRKIKTTVKCRYLTQQRQLSTLHKTPSVTGLFIPRKLASVYRHSGVLCKHTTESKTGKEII